MLQICTFNAYLGLEHPGRTGLGVGIFCGVDKAAGQGPHARKWRSGAAQQHSMQLLLDQREQHHIDADLHGFSALSGLIHFFTNSIFFGVIISQSSKIT